MNNTFCGSFESYQLYDVNILTITYSSFKVGMNSVLPEPDS